MSQIHILFVNHYRLTYSKEVNGIRISIPNHSEILPTDSKNLTITFKNELRDRGWKNIAIKSLEENILFPDNGKWISKLKMNINTGKISS